VIARALHLVAIAALAGCEAAPERGDAEAIELPELAWCDGAREWPDEASAREQELFALLEQLREQGGRCGTLGVFAPAEPLEQDGALQCAAREHAIDMAARDYFAHADPEGANAVTRMGEAGYVAAESTELLAAGTISADAVIELLWLPSDLHCAALRAPEWQRAGIGYRDDDGERGALWVVVLATEPR
jgi:uncharacterized protein YkwD